MNSQPIFSRRYLKSCRDEHEKASFIPEPYELVVECNDESDQKAELEGRVPNF
ncbi:MAG: hypothetical protein ACM3UY_01885 [Methanocella sp.]